LAGTEAVLHRYALSLKGEYEEHVSESQKRVIVACEKCPANRKLFPKPPVQLKNIPSTAAVRKALAFQE
jgi:hypothetical protein